MIDQQNDTNLFGLLYTADLMAVIGFVKNREENQGVDHATEGPLWRAGASSQQCVRDRNSAGVDQVPRYPVHQVRRRPNLDEILKEKLYQDHKIGVSTKVENRMRFYLHIFNTKEHIDRQSKPLNISWLKARRTKVSVQWNPVGYFDFFLTLIVGNRHSSEFMSSGLWLNENI